MLRASIYWFVLFNCLSSFSFGQNEWIYKDEKDGIAIYLRDVADSDIKELKMTGTVAGPSLSAFAALFDDLENLENWAYSNYDSKLLERISETEIIYYVKSDFPWPLSNRDFVLHNEVGQDSVTGAYYSHSKAHQDFYPEQHRLVRVTSFESSWRITPIGDGLFEFECIISSDPGGNIPAWLINMFIDVGPSKTIKAMVLEVQKEKYVNAEVNYIQEPEN